MTSYFVLVDRRDSEKFRRFQMAQFTENTKKILNEHDAAYIWGFHETQVRDTLWKRIMQDDLVCFTVPTSSFRVIGRVYKKFTDNNTGKQMWPDDLRAQQFTYFLLFDKLQKTSLRYNEVTDNAMPKLIGPLTGIYQIKKEFQNVLKIQMGEAIHRTSAKPKTFVNPKIPQKSKYEVNRFLRNPTIVKKLKEIYQNRCQVCGFGFEYEKGKFYSEVHHYNPLEENGNDGMDNMIVVCPNHHAQFDYKMIAISLDESSIVDKKGTKIGEIHFKQNHKLSKQNLASQLRME